MKRASRTPSPPTLPPLPLDKGLALVEPGPDVVVGPQATRELEEWITGWLSAGQLKEAEIPPPGPILLHGQPGTGKTATSRMIAARFAGSREVVVIDAMRVTESFLGATSANISRAATHAVERGAVLVLEEIDTLASSRGYESSAEVENSRSTTSIMRVLELPCPIVLTSNRLDVLDPAVMRRCEYVIEFSEPPPFVRRAIVARELGADPGSVEISLVRAIPIARRARRSAWLSGGDPSAVFAHLLSCC